MRPRRIPALRLRMNVEIRTRRATGAACWDTNIYFGRKLLSRRGSRNTKGADEINFGRRFFSEREFCNRRSCLHGHFRRRLRNRSVSDMADLAMILVVRVDMPVAHRVRGQQDQREDHRDYQQTFCCALHHAELDQNQTSNANYGLCGSYLQHVAIACDRAIEYRIHEDRDA
jgi:hypothetical protein